MKTTCPACAAGAPKTYEGKHHPGFNGKRFYRCRAVEPNPPADGDDRPMAAKQAFNEGGVFLGTD